MKNNGTLQVAMPTEREIVMTRVFDAPRRLVFDALTKPELFQRWFGPRGWLLAVCEIDLKVGGAWRSVLRGPGGREMGMRGVFQEIAPPERFGRRASRNGHAECAEGSGLSEMRIGDEERVWQVLGASRGEGGILGEGVRQALLRDPTYGPALGVARELSP